jgi:hypothetical protein
MITLNEFKERLGVICLKKGSPCLPKKYDDQQILFKSILLTLDGDKKYTEVEINLAITKWLKEVGREIEVDHVTLRRGMVDNQFLIRDDEGKSYLVSDKRDELFDPGINSVDPSLVVKEAIEIKEEKKRQFMAKGK